MEKDCYKEIIEEVSKKLAEKVCSEENGLAARATMIDQERPTPPLCQNSCHLQFVG